MKDLTKPETLRAASAAGILSTLLCLPRIWLWETRPAVTGVMAILLCFCAFVLWAFVFAWHPPKLRPIFRFRGQSRSWLLSILAGLLGGAVLVLGIDPALRPLASQHYPQTFEAWLAGWLFSLALVQLFLCFAPFCFFYRLFHSQWAAAMATVLFGVFLLGLQLRQTPEATTLLITGLVGLRLGLGAVAVYLFLRGGAATVLGLATLLHARLLLHLITSP